MAVSIPYSIGMRFGNLTFIFYDTITLFENGCRFGFSSESERSGAKHSKAGYFFFTTVFIF